jgi:hypothetical protein
MQHIFSFPQRVLFNVLVVCHSPFNWPSASDFLDNGIFPYSLVPLICVKSLSTFVTIHANTSLWPIFEATQYHAKTLKRRDGTLLDIPLSAFTQHILIRGRTISAKS